MDQLYEFLFIAGLAMAVAGWIWLLIAAFRTSAKWGLLSLLFPPVGIAFAGSHWRTARAPVGVVLGGLLVSASPAIYTRVAPIDLGPRRTIVDGQMHITLTGWDQHDYTVLRQWPEVVVLQMANPDVTNSTLAYLKGFRGLKELDLSHSQVTDDGLAITAQLPALEILRLQNCEVTDAGFREHLLPHPVLRRLDLTGTRVTPAVIREWRKANPERRAIQ